MTPPRSMSPISTTGTSAASAKPMLAMSPARRLISAGLPAPSTSTRSADAARRWNAARTCGSSERAIARYSRADCVECTWPQITSCPIPSDCGFSSTGFMSVVGGTPRARAGGAWARPISPPSSVTAALFDMFCGLNGRTLRPRRVKARASPATSSDLPTSEPVPCSISARVIRSGSSELDPRLRLDPGAERVLDQRHLGDEVGDLQERRRRVAAGDDDMQIARLALQHGHDLVERQIVVAQHDVQLVEQHHPVGWVGDHIPGRFPGGAGGGDVAGAVLRVPGEPLPHRAAGDEIGKPRQHGALAGVPGALDELHHPDPEPVPDAAQY